MDYPFHLGVTEAGDGVEGRVKSAIGIGALLEDGIGDTIRVSLTEDAVYELPAAHAIAAPYNRCQARVEVQEVTGPEERRNPYGYDRRFSHEVALGSLATGGGQPVRVELATTVSITDLDSTLAQIEAMTVPAQPNDPVCEVVRLRAETPAELRALASLNDRLQENTAAPLLSLCVPLAGLPDVPPLAGLAKIVVEPPREADLAA